MTSSKVIYFGNSTVQRSVIVDPFLFISARAHLYTSVLSSRPSTPNECQCAELPTHLPDPQCAQPACHFVVGGTPPRLAQRGPPPVDFASTCTQCAWHGTTGHTTGMVFFRLLLHVYVCKLQDTLLTTIYLVFHNQMCTHNSLASISSALKVANETSKLSVYILTVACGPTT